VFGWVKEVTSVTNEQLMDTAGLDAVMYVQFFRIGT
jgi:hypothetical protein